MAEVTSNTSESELRFGFGNNWAKFLETLTETQIAESARALTDMLGCDSLAGLRFLDIGCGSGLSSLAARRLGAVVHSFDYDPESVACTRRLKARFQQDDAEWSVEQGSALDAGYLQSLGIWDVVYSWGVLHHTGQMWRALDLATLPVAKGGHLFVAIYNDQGWRSRFWKAVKKLYCGGVVGRWLVTAIFVPLFFMRAVIVGLIRHGHPLGQFREYHKLRGMSLYRDWIDWIGGHPFEVATPRSLEQFYAERGFQVVRRRLTGRLGCNEFVFRRTE